MFQKLIQTNDDVAATAVRLTLAIVFFPHGAQNVLGWWGGGGFSPTIESFTAGFGMPWIVAFLVVMGEFLGPIGLAVGFLSRFAAFGLGLIMAGAIVLVHGQHGFFMNWSRAADQGHGFEYHLLAIGLCVATMIRGSGAFSIDRQLSPG